MPYEVFSLFSRCAETHGERTVNDADGTECTVGLEFWCLRTFLTLPW